MTYKRGPATWLILAGLAATVLVTGPSAAADLSPDPGFGDAGTVVVDAGINGLTDVTSVSNGYLTAEASGDSKVWVTKFDLTGAVDPTFGQSGRTGLKFNGYSASVKITERPSGDFLITNRTSDGFGLAVVNADGSVNRHFGRRGLVQRSTGTLWGPATTIDSRGRIVVASVDVTSGDPYRSRIRVWRFSRDGEPDAKFSGGVVTASPQRVNDVQGVMTDRADRVWLVTSQYASDDRNAGMSIVRISESGKLVRTIRRLSVWNRDGTYPVGISRRADGAILIGFSGSETARAGAFAVTSKGRLIRRYGDDGVVTARCSDLCFVSEQLVDAKGRLILAGGVDTRGSKAWLPTDSWVARFTASGTVDKRFMNGWQHTFNVRGRGLEIVHGIDLDGQGRLLVGGAAGTKGYLVRFAKVT